MAADDSSPQKSLGEIFELTKAYAKQETVDPIKGLGKFVGFGLGAAALGALSIGLLIVGVLRVLQTETGAHLTGSLTWVPYLITLVITVIALALTLGTFGIAGAAAISSISYILRLELSRFVLRKHGLGRITPKLSEWRDALRLITRE